MCLAVIVSKFVQHLVREWCPLFLTITDSLLAPGQEVLYKQYHNGELVQATILGPSTQEEFACLKYTRNGICMTKVYQKWV